MSGRLLKMWQWVSFPSVWTTQRTSAIPSTPAGQLLSIADKLDTLKSCFAVGLILAYIGFALMTNHRGFADRMDDSERRRRELDTGGILDPIEGTLILTAIVWMASDFVRRFMGTGKDELDALAGDALAKAPAERG